MVSTALTRKQASAAKTKLILAVLGASSFTYVEPERPHDLFNERRRPFDATRASTFDHARVFEGTLWHKNFGAA